MPWFARNTGMGNFGKCFLSQFLQTKIVQFSLFRMSIFFSKISMDFILFDKRFEIMVTKRMTMKEMVNWEDQLEGEAKFKWVFLAASDCRPRTRSNRGIFWSKMLRNSSGT